VVNDADGAQCLLIGSRQAADLFRSHRHILQQAINGHEVIPGFRQSHHITGNSQREQVAIDLRLPIRAASEEEAHMPVLLLWAVPTVIVIGGVGYYFLRVVH
jgi:hypothetical protein